MVFLRVIPILAWFACFLLEVEVEGRMLPPIVYLDNGTAAAPIWATPQHDRKLTFKCNKGYIKHPVNFTMCLPVCERGCPHGYCKSPGECGCLENRVELFGECRATCAVDGTCPYGECIGGMCTNCMPGYKKVSSGLYCEPRCERVQCDFKTQICTAPDTCSCRQGHKWQYNKCIPICERNCLHGQCVAPGQCLCYNGRPPKDGICQANCWMDCTNGICIQENVCECLDGFSLALPSLKCIEKCMGCENGKCIGPNNCQCNVGYKWSKSKKLCKPVCRDCSSWDGKECVAPNVCKCAKGFERHGNYRLKCKREKCRTTACKFIDIAF